MKKCCGHCVVFLGKTLFILTVPLSTQEYKWVPGNCQGNAGGYLQWTSIQSRIHATETGLSSSSYASQACDLTFFNKKCQKSGLRACACHCFIRKKMQEIKSSSQARPCKLLLFKPFVIDFNTITSTTKCHIPEKQPKVYP